MGIPDANLAVISNFEIFEDRRLLGLRLREKYSNYYKTLINNLL